MLRAPIRFVSLVVVLAAFALIGRLAVQGFYVEGPSMEPSLAPGQMVLVNRATFWRLTDTLGYLFGGPRRGEIVVFHSPTVPDRDYIKRIIGLPGESIVIDAGHVLIDGEELDEPSVAFRANDSYPADGRPLVVPPDAYFVLGDNRADSVDSRQGWFVPADSLVGQAVPLPWQAPHSRRTPAPQTQRANAALPPDSSPALPLAVPAPTPVLEPQWARGRLTADQPGKFVALGAPFGRDLRDVTVSATFRKVGGPPGGGYGLILRDQGPGPRDGQNQTGDFYVLGVGDRGELGMWRRVEDAWIDLLPWTASDAVRPGGAANEITARAQGPRLTLLVNGVEVASELDDTLRQGGVGVFAGGDGNDVMFEGFGVRVAD